MQIPSSLPTKPKPSSVVAPMPTFSIGSERAAARFFVMVGMWFSSFGFSAMMLAETLSTL